MARLVVAPGRAAGRRRHHQARPSRAPSPDEQYAARRARHPRATRRRRRVLSVLLLALVAVVAVCATGRLRLAVRRGPGRPARRLAGRLPADGQAGARLAPGRAWPTPTDDRPGRGRRVGADRRHRPAVPAEAVAAEGLWDPVPVTLPTYVSKPRGPPYRPHHRPRLHRGLDLRPHRGRLRPGPRGRGRRPRPPPDLPQERRRRRGRRLLTAPSVERQSRRRSSVERSRDQPLDSPHAGYRVSASRTVPVEVEETFDGSSSSPSRGSSRAATGVRRRSARCATRPVTSGEPSASPARIVLTDGGAVTERLTTVERPTAFGYQISEIKGPLKTLVGAVEGEWRFEPAGTGTRITWSWVIEPASAVGRYSPSAARSAVARLRSPGPRGDRADPRLRRFGAPPGPVLAFRFASYDACFRGCGAAGSAPRSQ